MGHRITQTGDGNVVGNNNTTSVTKTNTITQGATLAEFSALLAQLREELHAADLDDETRGVIDADVEDVEAEAKTERPRLPRIESRLKGIESLVKSTAGIGTAVTTLVPIIQKAVEYAHVIFR